MHAVHLLGVDGDLLERFLFIGGAYHTVAIESDFSAANDFGHDVFSADVD